MNGWIVYSKSEAVRNKWFIEHFIKTADIHGHTLTLKFHDEVTSPYPDFAIVRAFDYKTNELLESKGVRVFNNSKLAKIANNKALCYKFMNENGIPIMPTFYEKPQNPQFPLIVKSAGGHGGSEVVMVNNNDELIYASKNIPNPIYQQVASDLGKDLRVYVINNEIVASMLRQSITDFRSNYCLGGSASIYTPSEKEKNLVNKIISLFDIAYAGIDFVFNDGQLVFNEIEDAVGARMLYDLTDIDIVKEWFERIKL